jgi:hypothetical protein
MDAVFTRCAFLLAAQGFHFGALVTRVATSPRILIFSPPAHRSRVHWSEDATLAGVMEWQTYRT